MRGSKIKYFIVLFLVVVLMIGIVDIVSAKTNGDSKNTATKKSPVVKSTPVAKKAPLNSKTPSVEPTVQPSLWDQFTKGLSNFGITVGDLITNNPISERISSVVGNIPVVRDLVGDKNGATEIIESGIEEGISPPPEVGTDCKSKADCGKGQTCNNGYCEGVSKIPIDNPISIQPVTPQPPTTPPKNPETPKSDSKSGGGDKGGDGDKAGDKSGGNKDMSPKDPKNQAEENAKKLDQMVRDQKDNPAADPKAQEKALRDKADQIKQEAKDAAEKAAEEKAAEEQALQDALDQAALEAALEGSGNGDRMTAARMTGAVVYKNVPKPVFGYGR